MSGPDVSSPPADVFLDALDSLTRVAEVFTGYRERLEAMGWSSTAAEAVAAQALITAQTTALKGDAS